MLYKEAARIIQCVREKKGSVKSLVLSSKYKNIKQLYALVCETLKHRQVITEILELTKVLVHERKTLKSEELAIVLVYDLLFGKGIHSGIQKSIRDAIIKHKSALNSELAKMKVKHKVSRNEDLLKIGSNGRRSVVLPRYVRVNLITSSVPDVCKYFEEQDGYTKLETGGLSYEQYIYFVKNLKAKTFVRDLHLNDLLVFPPRCDLHDHPLYLSGDIILQDKASCLPAHCLNPPKGVHVFDTCAAPGNKTSHLASLMNNTGKVFSFDLDPKRATTMKKLLTSAKVKCAEVKVMDFLKVKADDPLYKNVQYAIVDPSCSGSGIVSRMNHLTDEDDSQDAERLENLAAFQSSIVRHVLTFPNMKKVVYSTCSIHEEENEKVVERVLQKCGDHFELEEILTTVPSRGHSIFPGAERALRLSPDTDATNGFFVACFKRTGGDNTKGVSANGKKVQKSLKGALADGKRAEGSTDKAENSPIHNKKTKKRKLDVKSDWEHSAASKVVKENTSGQEDCSIHKKISLDSSVKSGVTSTSKNKRKKKRKNKLQPVTSKS